MKREPQEKPILFSAPMVRAIRSGRKTQTRRIIRDDWWCCLEPDDLLPGGEMHEARGQYCPYGNPDTGDSLWVRETFSLPSLSTDRDAVLYRADGELRDVASAIGHKWRPSIFMPRWASRIQLPLSDCRIERLQDINEQDAIAEGVTILDRSGAQPGEIWESNRDAFLGLWDTINGKRAPAESNPWVWVLSFPKHVVSNA